MKLELSPALMLALGRAKRLAGAETVGPCEVLRGLLAEREGLAWQRLGAAGLDPDAWQSAYPDDASLEASDAEFDVSLRTLLTHASQESAEYLEEGSLSSDQVLSALLRTSEVQTLLAEFGVDAERLVKAPEAQAAIPLEEAIDWQRPDLAQTMRLIDACANRAREGLRVLEDYARFALNDHFLTGELKTLRHNLTQTLRTLPDMLAWRDVLHDVGTQLTTPSEHQRSDLADVVKANLKRLQESLRSLEEFGKIVSPEFGPALEALRYRSYTLEKALVRDSELATRLARARLYVLLTEERCRSSLVGTVREAVEGGADVVQLREKDGSDRTLLELAREVRRITRDHGALFIVNDRPDLARLVEADGVHLGQDDLALRDARRIVGPDALVGVSTHDLAQLRQAILDGASYVGIGPTFPSTTKTFAEFAGLDFVRAASAETSLPAFALGGIDLQNVQKVLDAGATRIAVSAAICGVPDPRQAARQFADLLRGPTSYSARSQQ